MTTEDPEEGLWPVKEEDQDCTAPHRRGAALSLWKSRTRWPPSLEMSVVTSQVNTEQVHLNQRESFLSWTRRLHRPAPRGNMTFLIAACWRAPSGPAASSGHRCSCPPQRQAIYVTQQNSGRQRRSLRIITHVTWVPSAPGKAEQGESIKHKVPTDNICLSANNGPLSCK